MSEQKPQFEYVFYWDQTLGSILKKVAVEFVAKGPFKVFQQQYALNGCLFLNANDYKQTKKLRYTVFFVFFKQNNSQTKNCNVFLIEKLPNSVKVFFKTTEPIHLQIFAKSSESS